MTKSFKVNDKQLAAEIGSVELASVRVAGRRVLALLRLNGFNARNIDVHLERGVWKIDETLDIETS